jgi:hypothetical protein
MVRDVPSDIRMVRPRFGAITRVLAGLFLIAGIGAGLAALHAGPQSTPGHGSDQLVLLALAIGFCVVGIGLFLDSPWAWWVGVAITVSTLAMEAVLPVHDGGWIPWSGFLILFGISAIQGFRDRSDGRTSPPPA